MRRCSLYDQREGMTKHRNLYSHSETSGVREYCSQETVEEALVLGCYSASKLPKRFLCNQSSSLSLNLVLVVVCLIYVQVMLGKSSIVGTMETYIVCNPKLFEMKNI